MHFKMENYSNRNCPCHRPIKAKTIISIIVWILTVSVASFILQSICPLYYVSANLLQFPSYSTRRPTIYGYQYQPKALLPPRISSLPSLTSVQNYEFYLNFVIAYSVHQKWDVAQLLFPRNEPNSCHYFRINLLKKASVQTTCHHTNSSESSKENFTHKDKLRNQNNNTRRSLSLTKWSWRKEKPIIAFHFMPKLANEMSVADRDRVDVNPRLLINYHPDMNVVVIAASQESTQNIIDQVHPEINTNYKWILASRLNETHMNLEAIYGISTSSVPLRHYFGVWSQELGISIDYDKFIGPSNFEGRVIRVTTVEGPPVVYVDRSSPDGIIKGKGFLPDIFLDTVTSNLNITYVLTTPPDNSFGSADENGTWSGMVGMLQRKEVEVALMSFSYTAGRRAVMDFSPPVEYSSARLLIRKDWKNNEIKWKAYSDPFEWKVWLSIPIIVCLGVFTFFIFAHFKLVMTTPVESAWMLSACFLQQGLDEHSSIRNFPCRLAMGSFWILAVVLYASYTARLTSFLAASTDNMPINSLNEAIDNRNWKIGLVRGSSVPDRVKDSPVPQMIKMWKRVQTDKSGYVSGFTEGISRVYKERFVFFTTELIPSFLVNGNCSYTWVPGKFFSGFGYMGYQKNLPYAASMSNQVAKIRETGQMNRLMKKWWGAESSCSVVSTGGEVVGMSLYETGTAFLALICGAMLAITVLLIEFLLSLKTSITGEETIDEQPLPPPSFSASTISSQAFPQNINGANEMYSNHKAHHPSDAWPQKPSHNMNGIFLRLTTPFHHLLRNERNTSVTRKWSNKRNTEEPFALNF